MLIWFCHLAVFTNVATVPLSSSMQFYSYRERFPRKIKVAVYVIVHFRKSLPSLYKQQANKHNSNEHQTEFSTSSIKWPSSLRDSLKLPQNPWLSTTPKLFYHAPYPTLTNLPALKACLKPGSYKHPHCVAVMLLRLSHGSALPYLDRNTLSLVSPIVYFDVIFRESAFRINSTQNTCLGKSVGLGRGEEGWMARTSSKCPHVLREWGSSLYLLHRLNDWGNGAGRAGTGHRSFDIYSRERNEWEARWATEYRQQYRLSWEDMNAWSSPQDSSTVPREAFHFKTMLWRLGRLWVYFEAAGRTWSLKSETLGSRSSLLHLQVEWSWAVTGHSLSEP